jgi:hypothetical protein
MQQPWKNEHFQGRFVCGNAPESTGVGVNLTGV